MPRKRDPNKQIRLRTKLDTAEQINDELRRTYRLQRNKQITAAEAKSWRELLVALRSGLPDTVERPDSSGAPLTINVCSAAEGQQYLPGNEVLMPFEESREVWRAYNAGPEAWAACLQMLEPKLTRAAYESLSQVPPFERAKLVLDETPLLRLVSSANEQQIELPADEDERQLLELLDKLKALSYSAWD